jgi:hypothetical protein
MPFDLHQKYEGIPAVGRDHAVLKAAKIDVRAQLTK